MITGQSFVVLRRLLIRGSKSRNLSNNLSASFPKLKFNRNLRYLSRLSSNPYYIGYNIHIKRSLHYNAITMSCTGSDSNNKTVKPKFTNKLIHEKSPYLLQHAHNPVDWYPWGPEAFEKAKTENKLIFLSVGYSTCHWCHVMEKESFEKEEIARIMNEHYVNIKVDREERPDIDKIYMLFVMATTGGGGWPMSVFLTPDLHPITGGTYFPPEDAYGRPGFKTFLLNLSQKWNQDRSQFMNAGVNILEAMQKISLLTSMKTDILPGEVAWNKCAKILMDKYEPEFGGFSLQPKFPQVSNLDFLFHYYARNRRSDDGKKCLNMCLHTLVKISKGGIHDHVSHGFARYAVDNEWQVPHFEKMLYDQAQLTVAFTDAYVASKKECFAEVAKNIIKYVNRDLRHESGGYYSAEDADSYPTFDATQKKEGAFYVWEYKELKLLLDKHQIGSTSYFEIFADYFNVEPDGNVSPETDPHEELVNKNVLIIYETKEDTAAKYKISLEEFKKVISESLEILHEARQKRPRPHLDTKILCSWNGLMILGLARAGASLEVKEYVDDAIKTANFIYEHMYDETTKTLLHSCYKGDNGNIEHNDHKINGFLDDYAFLIRGLLELYEASLDQRWLQWARDLQQKQNELFWDQENGGYFTSSPDDKSLVLRLKEDHDGAEPSGNSVSCHNLLRLASFADKGTGSQAVSSDRERGKKLLAAFSKLLTEQPASMPELMSALMFYTDSPVQVLIAGGTADPRTQALLKVVRSRLLPGRVIAVTQPTDPNTCDASEIPSRIRCVDDQPTAYVCRRFTCSLPVNDVKALEQLLDDDTATN